MVERPARRVHAQSDGFAEVQSLEHAACFERNFGCREQMPDVPPVHERIGQSLTVISRVPKGR